MRQPTLIINRQPHLWLYQGERCLLPLTEIEPHLVTHAGDGVEGLDPRSFPHTHVCRLDVDDQWLITCEWVIRTQGIRRIVAPNERFLLLAAELRNRFGIPGISLETATLFRDKVAMKTAAQAAGVAVPEFAPLDYSAQLDDLDWEQGPRIIKRRNMIGSMDVHTVATLDDARHLWHKLDASPSRYEVESFIRGAMYHCDSVVVDSRIIFASASRYLTRPGDFLLSSMGGSMIILNGDLRSRLLEFNARAIGGLGLRDGVTHLEAFHTPDDEIIFCEVAARPGGAAIDRINDHCYGINLIECAVRIEAGLDIPQPAATQVPNKVWGCAGFYPGDDSPAAAISAQQLSAVGIVESQHNPHAGDEQGRPRHSSDYADLYVLSAPSEAAFAAQVAALRAARKHGSLAREGESSGRVVA